MYPDTTWYGEDEYVYEEEPELPYALPQGGMRPRFHVDGMLLVAIGLALFMVFRVVRDRAETGVGAAAAPATVQPAVTQAVDSAAVESFAITTNPTGGELPAFTPEEMEQVAAPYEKYTLTQGLHGYSYGHAAIDLAAGKGEAVLSPINGFVTERYVDEYGNPTLVIENDYYRVTLLHGKYSVAVGERLALGAQVGVESNKGYTTDMQGRPCAGRDCGYHTHLNIFDKRTGENANPLEWITP